MTDINKSSGFVQQSSHGNTHGIRKHVKQNQAKFHQVFNGSEETPEGYSNYAQGLSILTLEAKQRKELDKGTHLDDIPAFNEKLSPELAESLDDLIKDIQEDTNLPIDYEEAYADRIDQWKEKFVDEQFQDGLNLDKYHQLSGQIDLMFISLIDQVNAKQFIEDVEAHFKDNDKASQERPELIKNLAKKYDLTKGQTKHLVDLLQPNRYSLANITTVLKALDKEYNISGQKFELGKQVAVHSLSALAKSAAGFVANSAPGVFTGAILGGLGIRAGDFTKEKHTRLTRLMQGKLNGRIAESLMLKKYENIDESKFAQIHTTLSRGRNSSMNLMANLFAQMGPQALAIASSVGFMGAVHPLLFVSNAVALPIIGFQATKFLPQYQDLQETNQKSREESTNEIKNIIDTAEDVLTAPNPLEIGKTLKTKQNEEDESALKLKDLNYKMTKTLNTTFCVAQGVTASLGFGLFGLDLMTEKQVLSGAGVGASTVGPFLNLVMQTQEFLKELQFVQEMEELLRDGEQVSLEEDALKTAMSSLDNHDIEIKNLDYLTEDGEKILDDVSLKIPQGSFMTVTGRSGEGKSTLMKCLLGLYTPEEGSVNFGGVARQDLKQYGEDSLRESISTCGQFPKVLEDKTLRENLLLYSGHEVSDEEIKKVLDQLGLSDFKTKLDKEVTKPSGGQRARIGIARALLRSKSSTKILVLDEPTSGLDENTTEEVIGTLKDLQEDVLDTLSELKRNRPDLTIICVTHKPSMYNKAFADSDRDVINFDISKYNEEKKLQGTRIAE